jgi:hypothetical protein
VAAIALTFGCPILCCVQRSELSDPKPPLSPEQQEAMIADVRQKALDYSKSLPNFICTQLTSRYSAEAKGEAEPAWTLRDNLTIRLTYFGQKEDYRVIQVNGKATDHRLNQVGGWTTNGDFGSMMRAVFEAKSKAKVGWERWHSWNDRPVAVLAYHIERADSQFNSTGQKLMHKVRANWAARGTVYADPETKEVVRLTIDSEDMPAESFTREVHIVLEYANQKIGDGEFLLPKKSMSLMTVKNQKLRLDTEFTAYKKFSTDTEIRYGTPSEETQPVKK